MINQFGQFIPDYPGQQYWQDPAYMRYIGQQQHQPAAQQAQPMQQAQQQPSSRMVEAAKEFPVPAGATQMIIGNDDSFIAVKAVSMTGQITFDIYDKRPPAPPEKPVDLGAFVTRDELEKRLAELKKEEVPEA